MNEGNVANQTTEISVVIPAKFSRLDAEALREWLERYSLSDLWEKNVLGAQP